MCSCYGHFDFWRIASNLYPKYFSACVGSWNIKHQPFRSFVVFNWKGLKVKNQAKIADEYRIYTASSFVLVPNGGTFWFAYQIHICIRTLNKN